MEFLGIMMLRLGKLIRKYNISDLIWFKVLIMPANYLLCLMSILELPEKSSYKVSILLSILQEPLESISRDSIFFLCLNTPGLFSRSTEKSLNSSQMSKKKFLAV